MTRRQLQFFLFAAVAYIGLRLAAYLPSDLRTFPDSGTYIHVADQPLLSEDFLAGWRPLTVPLFYKVLPDSDVARTLGQLVVSIACWLTLAATVAWNVRRPGLRAVAFALVLLFSLSIWITQWDRLILSESLTLSLGAAALAAWLAFTTSPGPWTVAAVLVSMGCWAFTRDSEASLALLAAPFALASAFFAGRRREGAVLAVGLVLIALAVLVAQGTETATPRRQAAVLNVIGARVLPSVDERRWFTDHGMPLPDQVADFAGTPLGTGVAAPLRPGAGLREDPEVAHFLRWAEEEGRQTLVTYLLTHPYRALRPVVDDAELLFAADAGGGAERNPPVSVFRADGTDPTLPGPIAELAYPQSVAAVAVWLGLVALAAAWLALLRRARPSWLVPAVALILQVPHAAIVWHGDPQDIPRHAISVAVLTRASLLILTIFVADALLEARASRRGSPDG